MKKSFLTLLLSFLVAVIAIGVTFSSEKEKNRNNLTMASWRFKSVTSKDPGTSHYLTSIYEGSEYRFADDHTFSGTFFGLPASGTWESANETLIINKGTNKEETYTFTISDDHGLVLEGTEKGNKVFINFVKI
jgi:hypothetical protein